MADAAEAGKAAVSGAKNAFNWASTQIFTKWKRNVVWGVGIVGVAIVFNAAVAGGPVIGTALSTAKGAVASVGNSAVDIVQNTHEIYQNAEWDKFFESTKNAGSALIGHTPTTATT